jgi:hypothetical protein
MNMSNYALTLSLLLFLAPQSALKADHLDHYSHVQLKEIIELQRYEIKQLKDQLFWSKYKHRAQGIGFGVCAVIGGYCLNKFFFK